MWIKELKENQRFTYGSNLAGRNGAGAALYAKKYFGAKDGIGQGPNGFCYALPTKDAQLKTLSLRRIQMFVYIFLDYALHHPELEFLLTPVGTGQAGYTPEQIAPMFKHSPINIIIPEEFKKVLNET